MANLDKKAKHSDIDSNIKEAFEVIDGFLPKRYTKRVQEIVPGATKNWIRVVKTQRRGPLKIIMALKKVALEEKELII